MVYDLSSPVGPISIEERDGVLLKVEFGLRSDSLGPIPDRLSLLRNWFHVYFSGQDPMYLPLYGLECSPFSRKVYDILLSVPYGEVVSYLDIARAISPRMSAQAVGTALRRNPLPLIIPCHRVIASDSTLGGYVAGPSVKRRLLEMEGLEINSRSPSASLLSSVGTRKERQ